MSETARIADQLRRAFDGEAWHGPAVMEILAALPAAAAAARPIANAHSIWELSLHIEVWEQSGLSAIGGKPVEVSDEENFPTVTDSSEAAWQATGVRLKATHQGLLAAVERMPEAQLTQQVPGREFDFYFLLHGLAQHALYHAGQIMLLKKAQE